MGGKPRLALELRERLRTLIVSELLTTTEIAERLELPRQTVYRERQRIVDGDGGSIRTGSANAGEEYCHLAAGESYCPTPVRCKGCGGLVHVLPCRLCLVAARLAQAAAERKLRSIKLQAPDTPIGRKQLSLLDGPDIPPPKKRRSSAAPYSSLLQHFRKRDSKP